MNSGNFFGELKRRNVYKVAVAYAVIAWLLIQAASILFPTFEAPAWVMKAFVAMIALGFPVALIFAWAFELTPEGIKRTEEIDPVAQARPKSHAWIYVVIGAAVLSAGLFLLGRYGFQYSSSGVTEISAKSIAVLPFDSLSRDPDNAFFVEGVQDEILTRLAKVADLKVIARTSTQRFKSSPADLRDVAKQLGVMHVLEGSVQKANDQVRVNVQLINATTNAHLWAEIYDRKLTDIFAVESDIAKTIADTLQAKLSGSEKQMIAAQPTSNTAAYELYHKGRSLWEQRSGDNIPKAIAFYEQAIAHDPNYALAHAGLANAYVLLPYYTGARRNDSLAKAREAALKALSLDSKLAEAHVALGKIDFFQLELAESIREYQRAIELKPNYATAHQWYGNDALVSFGRFEEAIAEGKRAVELDPLSPVINADLGITFYLARRYDDAIQQLKKTLVIDPTFFYAHYNLGIALQLKGDLAGAIAEYDKAKQLSNDSFTIALLGAAKGLAGDKQAAEQTLKELDQIAQSQEVDDYSRALVYLGLNNKEEALRAIDRALAARDGSSLTWIKVDPLLDPLHGDPHFEALVQKVINPDKQVRQ